MRVQHKSIKNIFMVIGMLMPMWLVNGCSLSSPPSCMPGTKKCESNETFNNAISYICNDSNEWIPAQICSNCDKNVCADEELDNMCSKNGEISCIDTGTMGVQLECMYGQLVPQPCGANVKCDGNQCGKQQIECNEENDKQCLWLSEQNLAIQVAYVNNQWQAWYCNNSLGCNGSVCNTPETAVTCTQTGEIRNNQNNTCICDDGYYSFSGECKPLQPCLTATELEVNEHCTFGRYIQGNNGNKTDLEWQILDIQGDSIFIISTYAIEQKGLVFPCKINADDVITWSITSIRSWLNGLNAEANILGADFSVSNFINIAFTSEDKEHIKQTDIVTPDNPYTGTLGGDDTKDYVFYLSIEEAENYFSDDTSRKAYTTARVTPILRGRGGRYMSEEDCFKEHCAVSWSLRSSGVDRLADAKVNPDGSISRGGDGVCNDSYGVRPALWLLRN